MRHSNPKSARAAAAATLLLGLFASSVSGQQDSTTSIASSRPRSPESMALRTDRVAWSTNASSRSNASVLPGTFDVRLPEAERGRERRACRVADARRAIADLLSREVVSSD